MSWHDVYTSQDSIYITIFPINFYMICCTVLINPQNLKFSRFGTPPKMDKSHPLFHSLSGPRSYLSFVEFLVLIQPSPVCPDHTAWREAPSAPEKWPNFPNDACIFHSNWSLTDSMMIHIDHPKDLVRITQLHHAEAESFEGSFTTSLSPQSLNQS